VSYFWAVWDANGWSGGKRSVIQYILDSKSKQSLAPFKIHDETVYLNADNVFPGINRDMLDLPLDYIEVKAHKDGLDLRPVTLDDKAKTAKEKALKTIENNLKNHEFWGNKTLPEIICFSNLSALPAGVIAFSVVWFIFFLLRWLVRGFCSDIHETCK